MAANGNRKDRPVQNVTMKSLMGFLKIMEIQKERFFYC
ncbi:hypothetical protein C943_03834 [Mariniradius saccharolyticus AK6]|uniref:Uncharacterized protein n=1 Tax=Mariniradius saccharolyticus AK6 TaxID=1239962 RepID=M7XHJ2_9BACT|nr:hypothetical protein C943_03834 [Mariniradius saccharolyticus AK6]